MIRPQLAARYQKKTTLDYSTEKKDGNYFSEGDIQRNDPALIEVVEELGEKADGPYSELKIVEIPDDMKWEIDEYDGKEWVSEVHRRFY